eukprot:jgi/Ulvmu1/11771/UM008_0185.1
MVQWVDVQTQGEPQAFVRQYVGLSIQNAGLHCRLLRSGGRDSDAMIWRETAGGCSGSKNADGSSREIGRVGDPAWRATSTHAAAAMAEQNMLDMWDGRRVCAHGAFMMQCGEGRAGSVRMHVHVWPLANIWCLRYTCRRGAKAVMEGDGTVPRSVGRSACGRRRLCRCLQCVQGRSSGREAALVGRLQ